MLATPSARTMRITIMTAPKTAGRHTGAKRKNLRRRDQDRRADQRSPGGCHATDDHDLDHQDGLIQGERGRTDVPQARCLDRAREAGDPRADGEDGHLDRGHVDAVGSGDDLVLPDGQQRPPEVAARDERGHPGHDAQRDQAQVVDPVARRELVTEDGRQRDAGDTGRAAGQRNPVVHEQRGDPHEAERDEREVVASDPPRREADHGSHDQRQQDAHQGRREEGPAPT